MDQFLENIFQNAPLMVSFLAGILTFLSPCILPLVPAYISYMCGENLQNIKKKKRSFSLLIQALIFSFGFSIIFILFGASSAKIINAFAPHWIKQFAGIIIIIFGLHFIGILRLSFLYKSKHIKIQQKNIFHTLFSPFILGISFALGWTPCLGPIFSSIILFSSTNETFGILLIVMYSIGLSVPFLFVALFIQKSFIFFNGIKKYFKIIEIFSGILLIALGLIVFFGMMDQISNWISQ